MAARGIFIATLGTFFAACRTLVPWPELGLNLGCLVLGTQNLNQQTTREVLASLFCSKLHKQDSASDALHVFKFLVSHVNYRTMDRGL